MAIQGYDIAKVETLLNELLKSENFYTILVEESKINGVTTKVRINIDIESR